VARRKKKRAEIEYLVQNILPFLNKHYGFPRPEDIENVRIDSIPVKTGRGTGHPDVVFYYEKYPVFVLEAKKEDQKEDSAIKQALSYIKNFPYDNPDHSQNGFPPRLFGVTIGKDIDFYKVVHKETKWGTYVDEPIKLDKLLNFDEILKIYHLTKKEKKKVLDSNEIEDFLYELTDIFVLWEKKSITPEIIRKISSILLTFLRYKEDFVLHEPNYLKLNKSPQKQRRLLDLLTRFNIKKSLGSTFAKTYRSFIIRAFQGTNLNQYITPLPVISFMFDLIGKIKKNEKILDFECGSGGFLTEAIERSKLSMNKIKGVEIDDLPCLVAKAYLTICFKKTGKQIDKIPIVHSNGLYNYGSKWDIVISNPAGGSIYKLKDINEVLKQGLQILKEKKQKFSEYELSVQQAIRSTKKGGRICLILPDGLFSNEKDKFLRDYIDKQCTILSIISLPRGVYKKGTTVSDSRSGAITSSMKMSVIFMKKMKTRKPTPIFISSINDSGELNQGLKLISEQWKYYNKSGQKTLLKG